MMKPVFFNESNVMLSYGNTMMPVLKDGKQVVSCWEMTIRDRFLSLIYGKIWVGLKGNNQIPMWLDSTKTVFINKKNRIKKNIRIVTYNQENECEKQDGVAPDSLVYCGYIFDITDNILKKVDLSFEKLFELLKKIREKDEDYCFIQLK